MPNLTKVCPECCASVNVKKTVCDCGHKFVLKRKVSVRKSKRIAMRCKRALETASETMARLEQDRAYTSKKRAIQTPSETMARLEQDRAYTAKKRAIETLSETVARLEQVRTYTAKKRASETASETIARLEQDRAYTVSKRAIETLSETMARLEQDRAYTASKRAVETLSETMARLEQVRTYTAKKRAIETPSETMARLEQDRAYTASKRAVETLSETMARLEQVRTYTAKKRAIETPSETMARLEQDRAYTAKKRTLSVTIDAAIAKFQSKAKMGPNFVCTVCHRMMYKQSVIPCNKSKYTKASYELLEQVFCAQYKYTSSDGNQWLCRTCDNALSRGNMPVQAKANCLQLNPIPDELSTLNALELRLISLRVPFMKMVALPSGKQRSIQGPAVNVPSKLDSVCTMLPRLPTQSELVALKLKRKLKYKGHYMYDYVSPEKLTSALRWLKANNCLYADIEINDNWFKQSIADDCDLFGGLVRQPETDCENSHPDPTPQDHVQDNSASHRDAVECEPSLTTTGIVTCESNSVVDDLARALDTLTALAQQNGFHIHDVPGDGNCQFNAIAYQLECVNASEMRDIVANHLENNSVFYCNFLAQPVASNNGYNADTEAPTDEDASIDSVCNPEQRIQLRWQNYIRRIRNGAWGDHITLQAIANEFKVAINVLSSEHSNITRIVPNSDNVEHEVYIGLILQYHYVGLDKLAIPDNGESSSDNAPTDNTDDPLNDDVIAEGDEHIRQITGGPQASMMSPENPEAFGQIVSIAPAEGQKPLSIMTDSNFEAMVNPDKFCFGNGTFNTERPKKLTYRKYFNQRLLDIDGRFAHDLDYLFVAQYIVEAKQLLDDGNNYIWRQKPQARQFTASQAKDSALLNQFVRTDKAYSFMKNIRGSPPYYQRTFYDLLAMIRQLGTPTWFFTLSAADLKWPDMIQTIAKQYGVHYSDEQVEALSFEQKSNWLSRNPVTAARHFHYRLNTFFQDFLKSTANPLGEIVDYGIRIEFQARGSPHAHCVIWVKDAPKYDVDSDEKVCAFIDQYITCAVPKTDGKLKDLVLLLQQHKHSTYCKRNKSCRFNFPKPPSSKTLIATPESDTDVVKSAQTVLAKVHKVLADGNTDLSLEDVLVKADISPNEYTKALEVSSKGSVVVLKREPNECNINNYNGPVTLAWQANTDIQYVLNAYACVMYVASYIMKTDRAMGQLLKRVASEARTDELKQQLRKVGSAFLTHREVSAQEAVYRILSLPMKQLSRSVVFVDTNPKSERIAVLKNKEKLNQLEDDDTDVFQKSLIDRYQHRPQHLQSMCLAEFAATYATNYQCTNDNECDALPPTDSETESKTITLTNGFGKMNKRKKEAVIRFRKYNKDAEPSNWYRAKLMLYYPWYNEQRDLLGGYETYAEHYQHVQSIVHTNEQKYCQDDVDNVDIDEHGPPEHLWSQIAPSTEEARVQSLAEGSEVLTHVSQEDLRNNAELSTVTTTNLHARFESASNSQEIVADEYRTLMRNLNDKQKTMVMFHRNWCKQTVIALKQGKPIEPYRVFLSGPGGVGKSHVIRLIHSDTIKFLKLSGTFEPDDVIVLLTAPTGVAAFNINGMTLHSALLLGTSKYTGFQPLNHDKLNTLRTKLGKLALIIIDEVSMVGSNMMLEIHKRLQQIKGVSTDVTFGGISILAVGDLYQLPPVGQPLLFNTVSDSYAQLYESGSLWVDEFEMIELSEIMRQRGDSTFSEMLCRVRTATCTPEDIQMLKSREITADMPNYPTSALHVYRLNVDVDSRNSVMLNNLAQESEQYSIKASDAVAGQTTHFDLSTLSDKRSETGGLHNVLKLAIGARVMLTTNVDVSDGLVNGARGEVVHIVTNHDSQVTTVLVKFDNNRVGLKAIQTSPYRATYSNAVPLAKYEVVFCAKGKRGSEITRLQFPLTLAWATTIHKVQGLTLGEIVVDMKGGRFSPGQAYVAFSRVKTLHGLHILNFNPRAIKASSDVQNEMKRLNSKLLPVPQFQYLSLPDKYVTIAFLNVRSIVAKLADIQQDNCLKAANIVCFCETWLSASQSSPAIIHNQFVVRCDRQTGDNKGGVMICIPAHMQPDQARSFTSNGIEVACTKFALPNGSHMQIFVLYRSPRVRLQALTDMLSTLLMYASANNGPNIMLGDFNEDILSHHNSSIITLMSNHGYSQLVTSPTTDQGTLIDHVYYNGHIADIIVETCDQE